MKKRSAKKSKHEKTDLSCDWKAGPLKTGKKQSKSPVCKYRGGYKWRGIKTEAYKPLKGDWNRIARKVLIGDGLKTKFHVRYFEIAPGGMSSYEKHNHEHIVIGIRGEGRVSLEGRKYKVKFLDVVHVSGGAPHQFLNPFKEPFGFLCVVTAKRDKPKLL